MAFKYIRLSKNTTSQHILKTARPLESKAKQSKPIELKANSYKVSD
jgi:hypothetical protein